MCSLIPCAQTGVRQGGALLLCTGVPDEFSITQSGVGQSGGLDGLLEQRAGPYPPPPFLVSRSGWGLRIWIFIKVLGDADAAGPVTTLRDH